jgi:hypothetical protein
MLVMVAGLLVWATEGAHAQHDPVTIMLQAGQKLVGPVSKLIRSATTEHARFYPVDDRTFIIPACDCGKTRISYNFDHLSWVPRGSQPVLVRLTIHGVDDTIRRYIRVRMKCDKQVRADRYRSEELSDGAVFYLEYGTDRDRAYYFVERGGITGQVLPQGAYFLLERRD